LLRGCVTVHSSVVCVQNDERRSLEPYTYSETGRTIPDAVLVIKQADYDDDHAYSCLASEPTRYPNCESEKWPRSKCVRQWLLVVKSKRALNNEPGLKRVWHPHSA
jgi:hypothetical protein